MTGWVICWMWTMWLWSSQAWLSGFWWFGGEICSMSLVIMHERVCFTVFSIYFFPSFRLTLYFLFVQSTLAEIYEWHLWLCAMLMVFFGMLYLLVRIVVVIILNWCGQVDNRKIYKQITTLRMTWPTQGRDCREKTCVCDQTNKHVDIHGRGGKVKERERGLLNQGDHRDNRRHTSMCKELSNHIFGDVCIINLSGNQQHQKKII